MREIFAWNLIHLRRARHRLSQAALARHLKLSLYSIHHYEHCRSAPSAYHVMLIADYFGCTMEELLNIRLFDHKEKEGIRK